MIPKGAKCPGAGCPRRFVWDWCYDEYVDPKTRNSCVVEEIDAQECQGERRILRLLKCNRCDTVLGVFVIDHRGAMVYTIPDSDGVDETDWCDINWEDDQYSYPHQ